METLYIQMDGEERERSCWADDRDTGIVGDGKNYTYP